MGNSNTCCWRFLHRSHLRRSNVHRSNEDDDKPAKMEVLPPLPIDLYLMQEFQAMDAENTGSLNCKQFTNLLLYLGYYQPVEKIRKKMVEVMANGDAVINQDDYVHLMKSNKQFLDGTKLLRDLFKKFDKDNSGYAFKTDVIQDLKEMGIDSPEMNRKIEAMDSNKDGNISYRDFLRIYFQGK